MHSATINVAGGEEKKKACMLMHLFGFSESLTGCLHLSLGRCARVYLIRQCLGFFFFFYNLLPSNHLMSPLSLSLSVAVCGRTETDREADAVKPAGVV